MSPNGLPLAVGVFAGLDIWGRATIKTDAGEQEFPPEAVRIADCNAGRQRSKITMTTKPSSACTGEGFCVTRENGRVGPIPQN